VTVPRISHPTYLFLHCWLFFSFERLNHWVFSRLQDLHILVALFIFRQVLGENLLEHMGGTFDIDAAQVVGLFMESIFYGYALKTRMSVLNPANMLFSSHLVFVFLD
jgi:hypothetical protein